MMKFIDKLDQLIASLGKAVSFVVLAIIAIIIYEMIARGVFNAPSPWAHELGAWLQVCFVFLGCGYALQQDQFVRIDILFTRFSPKVQAVIDATAGTFFMGIFAYVLITSGSQLAFKSYMMGEVSATGAWDGPVFISKAFVPIGGTILAIAWITKVIRDLKKAFGVNTET